MQIKTIHLKNYRGIEDLTVNFNSGVNLVIGNNGAGKSSLLAGISLILESMLFDIDANANKDFNRDDMRIISSLVGTITESIKYCVPVSVSCVFELEGTDYDTFYEYDENSQRDVTNVKYKTISKMNELVNNRNSRLPILSYQSDKRQFFTANDDPGRPYGQIERRQGYKDCVNGMASVEAIQNWCAQMDYAGYRFGHEVTEYVLFKKIVSRFIKELDDNDDVHVDFSPKLNRLVYSESGSGYLVHNLSAGYQSVLCLVMELAYRTALLNPNLDNSDDLEGIAVIDEIDMHLHPRWQWKIISALRATFPKVQFIIATHSPIVISSAENANLIVMKNPNSVKYLDDAYGYNVGDVLELTQESIDMPQEVKNWRHEIEQALDKNDLSKAEAIVQESANRLGEDSSTVKRMRDFLEVNKWIVGE